MMPPSKPLLTSTHRQQRYQWALGMKNQNWDRIIAADKTLVRLSSIKKFSW